LLAPGKTIIDECWRPRFTLSRQPWGATDHSARVKGRRRRSGGRHLPPDLEILTLVASNGQTLGEEIETLRNAAQAAATKLSEPVPFNVPTGADSDTRPQLAQIAGKIRRVAVSLCRNRELAQALRDLGHAAAHLSKAAEAGAGQTSRETKFQLRQLSEEIRDVQLRLSGHVDRPATRTLCSDLENLKQRLFHRVTGDERFNHAVNDSEVGELTALCDMAGVVIVRLKALKDMGD
jgi:hypothetical protein